MLGIRSRQWYCNSFNGYSPAVYFPFFPRAFVCVCFSLTLFSSCCGGCCCCCYSSIYLVSLLFSTQFVSISCSSFYHHQISVHICVCVHKSMRHQPLSPKLHKWCSPHCLLPYSLYAVLCVCECVYIKCTYICVNTKLRFIYVAREWKRREAKQSESGSEWKGWWDWVSRHEYY